MKTFSPQKRPISDLILPFVVINEGQREGGAWADGSDEPPGGGGHQDGGQGDQHLQPHARQSLHLAAVRLLSLFVHFRRADMPPAGLVRRRASPSIVLPGVFRLFFALFEDRSTISAHFTQFVLHWGPWLSYTRNLVEKIGPSKTILDIL